MDPLTIAIIIMWIILMIVLFGPEAVEKIKNNRHHHDWYVSYEGWHKDIYSRNELKYQITRCHDCSKYRLDIVDERKALA